MSDTEQCDHEWQEQDGHLMCTKCHEVDPVPAWLLTKFKGRTFGGPDCARRISEESLPPEFQKLLDELEAREAASREAHREAKAK